MIDLGLSPADLQVYLVIFARTTGLFAVAPIFGNRSVPAQLRLLLGFAVALVLFLAGAGGGYQPPEAFGLFLLVLVKALAFGLLMGFMAVLVFAGIQVAGHLIGLQGGFGLANVLDPLSGEQGSILDQLYLIVAILLFLAVNGHHHFLQGLQHSFEAVPIDGYAAPFAPNSEELLTFVARTTGAVFEIGLRIAVPVAGALLVTDVVMGLMARAIPQMNVFIVGAPLKLMVAAAGIIVALPVTAIAMMMTFERILSALSATLEAF